ncbi:MAG TPA: NADPH-dependent FMN reductase [Thiolinea sp.]|nr:NADPH-dependent FMN reductase [Thiolinea sp.]
MQPVKVLALCGSLRRVSWNAALLRTAAQSAPINMRISLYPSLGDLPLFNPDLESEVPKAVRALYASVESADALLIASPEYAHGVTGTIKNALDWLVSFSPLAGKLVVLLNASPRAYHADAALRETLRTMAATLVEEACISLPLLGSGLTEEQMLTDPIIQAPLRTALQVFEAAIRQQHRERV